jgi:nicotinic acid mononucleotide adenylyltransferase
MLGSYAPLTKGHLNAFILTRQTLLKKGFDLVVGVMSMNPEGHVAAKLKAKGQKNVPFRKRHELANCAFEDAGTDWMFSEKGQTQLFYKLKRDFSGQAIDFQLFFMNGADDVYAGRKYNDCGKTFPDGRKFVMVGRPGDTDKVQAELKKLGISGKDLSCLWIDNAGGYSSSMLRSAAMKGEWDKVWEVSDRCVAAFMSGPWMGKDAAMTWTEPTASVEGAKAAAPDVTEALPPLEAPTPTAPQLQERSKNSHKKASDELDAAVSKKGN